MLVIGVVIVMLLWFLCVCLFGCGLFVIVGAVVGIGCGAVGIGIGAVGLGFGCVVFGCGVVICSIVRVGCVVIIGTIFTIMFSLIFG